MNNTRKYLSILNPLFFCLLLVGTVSAYDADIACLNMREVMARSLGVTEIELIATGPLSVSMLKIIPDNMINSDDILCEQLKNVIREAATSGRPVSRVILTLSFPNNSAVERVSYELSPSTNMFIRLEEPFDRTKPTPGTKQEDPYNSFLNRYLLKQDITKSSVLANLQRIQKGESSPFVVTHSNSGLLTGTLSEARNTRIIQEVAGYGADGGDLALMKSELIRKYTSG